MAASFLQNFIRHVESVGALSRIHNTADPLLEISAITDIVCKRLDGGVALLFEKPSGSPFRVATNLFGSLQRICLALETSSIEAVALRLSELLSQLPAADYSSLAEMIAGHPAFQCFKPKKTRESEPDLLLMASPDLSIFPFLQNWPEDGSAEGHPRYMTLPQVFTVDPESGLQNSGLYRVQIRGTREVAIQWKSGSGAARHMEKYQQSREPMPVAIVLGGHPAVLFSSMLPLPGELDEVHFAGFLCGSPLETSPCVNIPITVPTGAEVVIEGYVDPGSYALEGPFGNHTGSYAAAAPAPLMHVTAIRHRVDAIIPATLVGRPPMEDCRMAQVWESLLRVFLKKLLPEVADIHMPFEWSFHQSSIVSLENPHPGMVQNVSARLWALPWFRSARFTVFVSAGSPLSLNYAAWRAINLADFSVDVHCDRDTGRVALDATGHGAGTAQVGMPAGITELVTRRWKEYGIA